MIFVFSDPEMTSQPMPSKPAAQPEPAVGRRIGELARAIEDKLGRIERELGAAAEGHSRELLAEARREFGELRALAAQAEELSSLSAYLQRDTEREKAALARELHDNLGGILTPAKMDLSWLQARLGDDARYAERMGRLNALIDQAIDLKRRIIENLRPSLLDHLGLASALHWYVDETSRKAGIEPHLAIAKELERLPADLEIACFRLVQEGLDNVVKHSHAKHVDLTVERTGAGLHMTVSDDGVGIDDLEAAKRLSHGLAGMSQRARALNGRFDMRSLPGQGTRIEVFIPLPAAVAPGSAASRL